jgi:hypothetical protein
MLQAWLILLTMPRTSAAFQGFVDVLAQTACCNALPARHAQTLKQCTPSCRSTPGPTTRKTQLVFSVAV